MRVDELRNLYIGQSFDLYWTYNVECPTVEEHLKMIDCSAYTPLINPCHESAYSAVTTETGGLFRLLSRLTLAHSSVNTEIDLGNLPTLLGRYFQIRDDYQNLVSPDVSLRFA